MSTDAKRPYAEAYRAAQRFEEMLFGNSRDKLAELATHWRWAGSLRRQRELVGDLELVAVPAGPALWQRLDELLAQGRIAQAVKSDGHPRWGECYRALAFTPQGGAAWTVELFLTTPESWGLQFLIRTGSADFSRMVVTRILTRGEYRAGGGSLRPAFHKKGEPYRNGIPAKHCDLTDSQVAKLPVVPCPTERAVFEFAGLAVVPPAEREVKG